MPEVKKLTMSQLVQLIKLHGGGSGGGGGSGDVTGPGSSTDNAIVRFDGTGGKTLQDSGCTIDDSDNMTVDGNVGIGGAPSTTLHVQATDPRIRADATAGNHPGFELSEAGSRKWVLYNDPDASDNLRFKSTADRFEITQGGNLHVKADSSVINMGVGNDVTFTHDGTTGLTIASTPMSLNSTGDLTLSSSANVVIPRTLTVGGSSVASIDDEGAIIAQQMLGG